MENKNSLTRLLAIIFIGFLLYAVLGGFADETNQQQSSNSTTDVGSNVRVEATPVQVTSFYDGEYGYSVSIPGGNRSTCVWNWEGGNAAIPDSTTTYANTATEKHTVVHYGNSHNFKVNCFDDFGNQYVGVFPNETQSSITSTGGTQIEGTQNKPISSNEVFISNTETDSLQIKRDDCTNSLNDFKLKTYEDNSYWSSDYLPLSSKNFIIGYSPDLDICVGGYVIQVTSGLSGHISIAYTIVDAKTNKTLDIWMNTDNTYDNFITTLSYLTNGQIGGGIEREHTSDMVYCNNAYHRCSVGDKPICPPNNGTFWRTYRLISNRTSMISIITINHIRSMFSFYSPSYLSIC